MTLIFNFQFKYKCIYCQGRGKVDYHVDAYKWTYITCTYCHGKGKMEFKKL